MQEVVERESGEGVVELFKGRQGKAKEGDSARRHVAENSDIADGKVDVTNSVGSSVEPFSATE